LGKEQNQNIIVQVDVDDLQNQIVSGISEIKESIVAAGKSYADITGKIEGSFGEIGIQLKEIGYGVSEIVTQISNLGTSVSNDMNDIISQNKSTWSKDISNIFLEAGLNKALESFDIKDIFSGTGNGKYLKKGGKYLPKDSGGDSSGTLGLASNADVMTAGLSELVDLWDSEAAAKALSTAATTAWNAVCSVGTTIAGAFGAAINFLTSPIGVVVMAITALIAIIVLLVANWDTVKAGLIAGWETVKALLGTAAEWFNTTVIQPIAGFLTALWTRITTFVSGLMVLLMPYIQQFMLLVQTAVLNIQTFFSGLGEYLTGVFSVNWAEQFGAFGEVLNVFFAAVQEIWTAVQTIFEGIIQFVTGVFSGDWESAWNGIVQIFSGIWEGLEAAVKTPINGVIGLINGLVKAVVSGINGAIDALNTLRFTVPDWVPEIGGKYFGFNIGKISAPQIPYLAQGAVLPANRPFLAVVGDQKHGTNVEAPLETIQQALADVLAQQGAQDIRITFTGDLAQLARVLKPQLDRENRRVGGSLARGVTV